MLRRLAAVIFAVVVISLGLSMRAGRDDADGRLAGGGGGGVDRAREGDSPYDVFENEPVDLLCAEDLRQLCTDNLDLMHFEPRIEPVWTTIDRLERGEGLDADVWLTLRPFDAVAAKVTPGPAPLGAPTPVLARSAVVLAGPPLAVEAIEAACPDPAALLACAATTRAQNLALRDPRTSAAGAIAFASVAHELGVPADAVSVDDPAVREQLAAVRRAARKTSTPYTDALRVNRDLVALTLEADARLALEAVGYEDRKSFGGVTLRWPIDVRAAEVVAVPAAGFRRTGDLEFVLRSDAIVFSFGDAGYEIEEETFRVADVPVFAARPPTRTDLPYDPELLRMLRTLGP